MKKGLLILGMALIMLCGCNNTNYEAAATSNHSDIEIAEFYAAEEGGTLIEYVESDEECITFIYEDENGKSWFSSVDRTWVENRME